MKFTLSWLKDHLETDASVEQLAGKLNEIGLEVESIDDPSAKLGAFTVARIVDAKKHPNADKLQIVYVEAAPGEKPYEVVCGAPNARKDLIGVFAPLGTTIPAGDFKLVEKPVRGVVSNGMMCSAAELELSEESEGIIELDESFADKIGQPYVSAAGLDDPVFDISITPNRPDCTGVRGIARDLAAAGLGKLKDEPALGNVEGKKSCPIDIELQFSDETADACPVFAGRVVSGVKNGSSPDWLQQRLRAIGLRPINILVDVTNYISYDRARPLHVYDADKLNGAVRARLSKDGESFLALDGKTYWLDDTMCVIADDSGVLGLGGVIGGEESGSTDETTNVLIESAWFDPARTAQTGRKNDILSDARYRFERSVDPASVVPGLDLATDMILKLCGGTPSAKTVAGKEPINKRVIAFDPDRVGELSGADIPTKEAFQILNDLGFAVEGGSGVAKVTVPTWRPDVHGSADLVEEVVRIAGLDRVPATPLPRVSGVSQAVLTPAQKRARRARRALAARGFVEAVTWSFITKEDAELFGGGDDSLDLANPISVELSAMRPSLLPGLLAAVTRNRNRGSQDVALFELGQAYNGDQPEDQFQCAAGVRSDTANLIGTGRHWSGDAAEITLFDVKADVVATLFALGLDATRVQTIRNCPVWYHPGRSGALQLGPKKVLAYFGELHPATLKALGVDAPVVGFEIFLDALPPEKKKARTRAPLPSGDLLPVKRDFAFVVDQDVAAGDILKAATGADKVLIQSADVFDIFAGGALAENGKKSVAIEVVLQPKDETLTDTTIDSVSQKIIAAVKKATGGEIRG